MKPTLAPPRHSSTPTCTIRDCALAPATEATRLATASPARRSERRMKYLRLMNVMRAETSAP